MTKIREGIVQVPEVFNYRAAHPFPYPEDNYNPFEEWYYKHFELKDHSEDRLYLPVFWTGYYIRANYAKNQRIMRELQFYLNSLDRKRKYYTICQYDDGILHNLSALDIKVFSMSGKPIDYPLPLICPLHRYHFEGKKQYLFNFIGQLTHPVRNAMVDYCRNGLKTIGNNRIYVSTEKHSLEKYCSIISQSLFTLCPRGYGPTSFRIMEALQYGSIPVYISDEHIHPHNQDMQDYCLVLYPEQVQDIESIIEGTMPDRIQSMQARGREVFNNYFTYENNKKIILQNL